MDFNRRNNLLSKIEERTIVTDIGCLIWTGPNSGTGRGGGYPRMYLDGTTVAVHRIMYQLWFGPLVGTWQVDHICRNRLCVNPHHLEKVTHKENCRRRDDATYQSNSSEMDTR